MSESQNGAVVVAHDVTRRYGEGDTAVDALRGVTVAIAPGKATAVMGPSGSGKSTLMHILAGLDKPTSGTVGIAGHGDHDARRQRPDEAPPRAHRLRLPVLQPAADAEREGEHPPSADDRRREAGRGVVRPARVRRRAQRSPVAPALGALGRSAAARGDRASARHQADRALRRRADRQPRLGHERGNPRAPPPLGRRVRPDDRHGHARRARGSGRAPRALPRRRRDRARARRVRPAQILTVMEEVAAG